MEGINVAVTIAVLAVLVQIVVERVRGRVNIDGDIVFFISWVLGGLLAWYFGLAGASELGYPGLPVAVDYVLTGLVIAGGSGLIAASKNSNRSNDPTSSLFSGSERMEDSRS